MFALLGAGLVIAASVAVGPAPAPAHVAKVDPRRPLASKPESQPATTAISNAEPPVPVDSPVSATTVASTFSSGPSSSQPSGVFHIAPAMPLPPAYRALLARSLFADPRRGAVIAAAHTVAAGPAATLVLRGVGVSDGRRTAYIEDLTSKQITRHHEGDSVAGGRIGALSIDQMMYEAGSALAQVKPGQNLLGQTVAAPPPAASQPVPPQGGPPRPNGAPPVPIPPGGPNSGATLELSGKMMRFEHQSMPMPEGSH